MHGTDPTPRPGFKKGDALSRAREELQWHYRTTYEPRYQLWAEGLAAPARVSGARSDSVVLAAWVKTGAHHDR